MTDFVRNNPLITTLIANPLLILALALLARSAIDQQQNHLPQIAKWAVRIIDGISETLIRVVKWFALAMVLITGALVFGRYVFGVGSIKGQETVIYLHALLFLLAGSATLLHEGHVRVDVFYAKMSANRKAIVDLIGTLIFLIPVCAAILILSEGFVTVAFKVREGSPEAAGLPWVYLLKGAIPMFASLMLLQGSAMALRAALQLTGYPLPAPKRHHEPI